MITVILNYECINFKDEIVFSCCSKEELRLKIKKILEKNKKHGRDYRYHISTVGGEEIE